MTETDSEEEESIPFNTPNQLTNVLLTPENDDEVLHVTQSTVLFSSDEDRVSNSSNSINYDNHHPGFAMVWDNVQVQSVARHRSETKQNTMHMWALAFSVENRISFRHLETLSSFLMPVAQNIPHQYGDESRMKSNLVNLGVFEENPSVAEVVSIMDNLHRYVPVVNDECFLIPCHGDGLSVERTRDAKGARAGSETRAGKLEGLEPMPQEFHNRCLILLKGEIMVRCSNNMCDKGLWFHLSCKGLESDNVPTGDWW